MGSNKNLNKKLKNLFDELEEDDDFLDEWNISYFSWEDGNPPRMMIDREAVDFGDRDVSVDEWPNIFVSDGTPKIYFLQEVTDFTKRYRTEKEAEARVNQINKSIKSAEIDCDIHVEDIDKNAWYVQAKCSKNWEIELPQDASELGELINEKSDEMYYEIREILGLD